VRRSANAFLPSGSLAQQADRREQVGGLPLQARVQHVLELAPAVEQPGAAYRGALQPVDQPGGLVGVLDVLRPGDAHRVADARLELGVEDDRPAGVPDQATAQHQGLVGLGGGLLHGGGPGRGGDPGGLGPVDAVELPRDLHGPLEQVILHLAPRLELVLPVVEALAERLRILARQHRGLRAHPMFHSIKF
jgi:hypothetical protein